MPTTIHCVLCYQDLMRGTRASIVAGRFADFRAGFHAARGLAGAAVGPGG